MPKFNTQSRMPPRRRGPVRSTTPALTANLGVGYLREPKSELFLLGLSNMVGEHSFSFEHATARDERFEKLISTVVHDDPDWVARFIPWLRTKANMRSAAIVLACEYVRAGGPKGASVVNSAIARADEPAEALSYWISKYGRPLPYAIKRGIARAAARLYNETTAIKYDGQNVVMHFGDVILMTRPVPRNQEQNQLFQYMRYRWRDNDKHAAQYPLLTRLAQREDYETVPMDLRRMALRQYSADIMPWEHLAGWLPGGMDVEAWEAVIPYMGVFALTRNLRNFDEAGISEQARAVVAAQLSTPAVIASSRMFPLRFFSAWRHVSSMHWGVPLEKAVNLAVQNIPSLSGRTLIVVDRSGSMFGRVSHRSELDNADAAALFGSVLAVRAENATLVQYGTSWKYMTVDPSQSVLRMMERFDRMGSTNTMQTIRATYSGHDRIVVLTDEQANFSPGLLDYRCPIFTFNVGGQRVGHLESGVKNHFTFGGGLSDATFTLLDILDKRADGSWPF